MSSARSARPIPADMNDRIVVGRSSPLAKPSVNNASVNNDDPASTNAARTGRMSSAQNIAL